MTKEKKDYCKIVGLRLDKKVADMLTELAEKEGVSEQSTLRLLIRRSHAARGRK